MRARRCGCEAPQRGARPWYLAARWAARKRWMYLFGRAKDGLNGWTRATRRGSAFWYRDRMAAAGRSGGDARGMGKRR